MTAMPLNKLLPLLVEVADRDCLDIDVQDIMDGHHRIDGYWWLAEKAYAAGVTAAGDAGLLARIALLQQQVAEARHDAARWESMFGVDSHAMIETIDDVETQRAELEASLAAFPGQAADAVLAFRDRVEEELSGLVGVGVVRRVAENLTAAADMVRELAPDAGVPVVGEVMSDEVYDAAIRVLLKCPDVPAHAHIPMSMLRRMAEEQSSGTLRPALQAAYTAALGGRVDVNSLRQAITERAAQQLDSLLDEKGEGSNWDHGYASAIEDLREIGRSA